jgi:hypothetical protein
MKASDVLFCIAVIYSIVLIAVKDIPGTGWWMTVPIPLICVLAVYFDIKESKQEKLSKKLVVPTNPIRYAVHPGYVTDKTTGDQKWINFKALCELYGIDTRDCIRWDSKHPETFYGRNFHDYVHLYPRSDGKYEIQSNN